MHTLHFSRSYEVQNVRVGAITVPVLALQSSSTDFDLTGTIIWPISEVLSWYVFENRERLCKGKDCLELGAGTGLCGFTASLCLEDESRHVIITDGNETVCNTLKESSSAHI